MNMSAASRSRDILEELFSVTEEKCDFDLEGLDKIIHKGEVDASCIPGHPDNPAPSRPPKKRKSTHYLSEDVSDSLEHAKAAISDMLSYLPGAKVSKSRIVNIALRIVLDDFAAEGRRSQLVKMIAAPPGSHHMHD